MRGWGVAEIVPDRLRNIIYAFDRSFEMAIAAASNPLVGVLAEKWFGFDVRVLALLLTLRVYISTDAERLLPVGFPSPSAYSLPSFPLLLLLVFIFLSFMPSSWGRVRGFFWGGGVPGFLLHHFTVRPFGFSGCPSSSSASPPPSSPFPRLILYALWFCPCVHG